MSVEIDLQDDDTICEFCGLVIEDEDQDCAALESGRCRP